MLKDLSEALNESKKQRGVFSKTIIWESGISKSQFYRIIKGEEAPSPETKARISKSLGIDVEQFDLLFQKSKFEQKHPVETESSLRLSPKSNRNVVIICGVAIILCLAFLVTGFLQRQNPARVQTHVAIEEDKTLFIADVTIPDGTSIPVNTTFVKTWRVKNIGNITWENRYLKRMTPASNLICSSPGMVPIPETAPGETVDISVTFKTPHLPGSCRTDWKASDNRGNLFFPDLHGLYSIVNVVSE